MLKQNIENKIVDMVGKNVKEDTVLHVAHNAVLQDFRNKAPLLAQSIVEEMNEAIELLKKLRALRNNSNIVTLLYRSPADQLRESANQMEYEEALLREIDSFITSLQVKEDN